MTKECSECKKNGHAGIQVTWKPLEKDDTGKVTKWKALNPDGSDHEHKTKGAGGQDWEERNQQIKQAHDENMAESKLLRASIDNLTAAINNAGAKLGALWFKKNEEQQPEEGPEDDQQEEGPP